MFSREKSDKIAQDLLGMSFKLGGRGPQEMDCYGVLVYYFKEFGLSLPDYSYVDDWNGHTDLYLQEYAKFFRKLDKDEKLEIGDVILFCRKETTNHTGVYLGESKFVHSFEKAGTKIDSLTNPVWKSKVYGYFRAREEK